ncbi:farnesyl-diphosphate synthase [Collybia nuda]|uniref:(2E,6E)-farnesyl diphosphate synthase n=1 Tax=Collybia nuda TaxID=64659 RepID=A0A9P6CGL2_9AGAR|nr:farnesyl-diphosphate synthase [Collybia nuda]
MSNVKAARRARFEGVFTLIHDELITYCQKEGMPPEAVTWFGKNLEHNVPGGKLNRGMAVVDTVEILKGRPLTEEEYVKAAVLGWCVELLQAYFLVSDDMMDRSITRRGQPCWYLAPSPAIATSSATPASLGNAAPQSNSKHPLVGMVAINDSFMLASAIFHLLKQHFRGQTCYMDLVEIFHDITFKTEMGQLVDLVTAPEGVVDLARFSMERHRVIVTYKTAYYSFHLPVAIAMHMCNIPTTYRVRLPSNVTKAINPYDLTLAILLPLGEYFQIQDDFLDFSATPEVLGKIGTDIVDNKCSWCINKALELCTPEQRLILERNYGRKGDIEAGAAGDQDDVRAEGSTEAGGACERRVKEVYEALNLRQVYADYEANVYRSLNEMIDGIPEDGVVVNDQGNRVEEHSGLKRQVFRSFLDKIYGRRK